MQASGAKFDMVMSTKEQETFETALVTPTSLDSIRAGLSKVDVRQVRTLYTLSARSASSVSMPEQSPPRALSCAPPSD